MVVDGCWIGGGSPFYAINCNIWISGMAGRCIYPEKMVAKHFWLQMEQWSSGETFSNILKKDCYTIATYLEMQPQQIICGLSTHKIRSQAEAFQDVPGNCKCIVFFVEDESNEHQLDRNRCPCHFVLPCDQAVLWYIHTTVFHVLLEVLNNARYFKTALTLLFFLPIDKFYIESKRNEMLSCHQATKFPINSGSLDKKSHQSPSGHDVYSGIARCYVVGVQNARFFE